MTAVLRRELNSYFTSASGYVYLAAFFCFSGIFFYTNTLYAKTNDISSVFSSMYIILMVIVPILTMKLLSEDKKLKTDQLLFTSPVSISGIVIGKFISAWILYALGTCIMLVFGVVIAVYVSPEWITLFLNIAGMLLMGGAMISIGLFVSSLTESQAISAVGGFVIMMLFTMMDAFASFIPVSFLSDLLPNLSFSTHYNNFVSGSFNFSDVMFFLSVMVIFLFVTIRVLEKKRWS